MSAYVRCDIYVKRNLHGYIKLEYLVVIFVRRTILSARCAVGERIRLTDFKKRFICRNISGPAAGIWI